MAANLPRIGAYVAAGVLASLTVAVFYSLQDYGPESAIRRFHSAVSQGSLEDLRAVTAQPLDSPKVVRLVRQVKAFFDQGFRYQLVRMDRSPQQVRAAVVYTDGRDVFPMIWVVEKNGRTWQVDAEKMDTIRRDSLGLG